MFLIKFFGMKERSKRIMKFFISIEVLRRIGDVLTVLRLFVSPLHILLFKITPRLSFLFIEFSK